MFAADISLQTLALSEPAPFMGDAFRGRSEHSGEHAVETVDRRNTLPYQGFGRFPATFVNNAGLIIGLRVVATARSCCLPGR